MGLLESHWKKDSLLAHLVSNHHPAPNKNFTRSFFSCMGMKLAVPHLRQVVLVLLYFFCPAMVHKYQDISILCCMDSEKAITHRIHWYAWLEGKCGGKKKLQSTGKVDLQKEIWPRTVAKNKFKISLELSRERSRSFLSPTTQMFREHPLGKPWAPQYCCLREFGVGLLDRRPEEGKKKS